MIPTCWYHHTNTTAVRIYPLKTGLGASDKSDITKQTHPLHVMLRCMYGAYVMTFVILISLQIAADAHVIMFCIITSDTSTYDICMIMQSWHYTMSLCMCHLSPLSCPSVDAYNWKSLYRSSNTFLIFHLLADLGCELYPTWKMV